MIKLRSLKGYAMRDKTDEFVYPFPLKGFLFILVCKKKARYGQWKCIKGRLKEAGFTYSPALHGWTNLWILPTEKWL